MLITCFNNEQHVFITCFNYEKHAFVTCFNNKRYLFIICFNNERDVLRTRFNNKSQQFLHTSGISSAKLTKKKTEPIMFNVVHNKINTLHQNLRLISELKRFRLHQNKIPILSFRGRVRFGAGHFGVGHFGAGTIRRQNFFF